MSLQENVGIVSQMTSPSTLFPFYITTLNKPQTNKMNNERKEVLGRTNGLISFDMTQTAQKITRSIIFLLLCAYLLIR
jgi:hypothetical protein